MIYNNEVVYLKNSTGYDIPCKQINSVSAKTLHNKGVKIWLHPCNLTLRNMWQEPYDYQKSVTNTECFESIVNSFRYYNCDKERGKRVIFFAECDKNGNLKK